MRPMKKPSNPAKKQRILTIDDLNSTFEGISERINDLRHSIRHSRTTTITVPGLDEPATPIVMADLFPPQLMPVYIRDFVPEAGVMVTEMSQDKTPEVSSVVSDSAVPTPTSTVSIDLSIRKPSFDAIDHLSEHIESLTSEIKESQLNRTLKRVASRSSKKSAVISSTAPTESVSGLKLKDDQDIEKRRKAREKRVTELLDSGKKRHISSSSV